MNREDMIRMAREAGWEYATDDRGFDPLWRFAALVAAAEREACAKVCENDAWRCKKIAVETQDKKANAAALEAYLCAEAIRARGHS